jgi:hypothetical protein
MPPLVRLVAALLHELALRRAQRILAGLDFSRRQLDEMSLERVAKLTLHEDRALVEEGDDHAGAGMVDVLAHRLGPVRQPHPVRDDVEQHAVVRRFRLQHDFAEVALALFAHGFLYCPGLRHR